MYRLGLVSILLCMVGGSFVYLKYQNGSLKREVQKHKQEIVEIENEKKVEVFEERWRTIAEELNNSTKIEEKKDENITIYDGNGSFVITF